MNLTLQPITADNREEALTLKTAPGQENYVESVEQCLKEADNLSNWRPVAIYDGSLLVGFAMYGFFPQYFPFGRVWMDRLLIDQRYQHKGYGKEAMRLLIERLRAEYHCRRIYLSIIPGNTAAASLYQGFGFRFNGRKDIHGEKIMVLTFPRRPA